MAHAEQKQYLLLPLLDFAYKIESPQHGYLSIFTFADLELLNRQSPLNCNYQSGLLNLNLTMRVSNTYKLPI
jgi:hypothetical protein